jgi:hypothetical protein
MVSFWVMLPAQRTAAAFAFNREDYGIVPLVPNVLAVVSGGEPAPFQSHPPPPFHPPEAAKVAPATIAGWTGVYDTREGDLTIAVRGDSLRADLDGGDMALVPASDTSAVVVADDVKDAGRTLYFRNRGRTMTVWGPDSLGYRR